MDFDSKLGPLSDAHMNGAKAAVLGRLHENRLQGTVGVYKYAMELSEAWHLAPTEALDYGCAARRYIPRQPSHLTVSISRIFLLLVAGLPPPKLRPQC
jgi:hypothetical protein